MFLKRQSTLSHIFSPEKSGVSTRSDLFNINGGSNQVEHECFFEEKGNSRFPQAIVPYDEDLPGFFADVATFYPGWSPISAHAHVINADVKKFIPIRGGGKPRKAGAVANDAKLRNWSALTYCEAASRLAAGANAELEPSFSACRQTLSYCLARASFLYPDLPSETVVQKFKMLREILGIAPEDYLTRDIVFISSLYNGNYNIQNDHTYGDLLPVLEDYANSSVTSKQMSSYLGEFYPEISRLARGLAGDFDNRMNVFLEITKKIDEAPQNNLLDTIAIAFFADQIQPGSMRHSKSLSRQIPQHPTILLWYSFFASMAPQPTQEPLSIGVERKVQRDICLEFSWSSAPSVDISIDEFHVLARINTNPVSLRPIQPRTLNVSLLPGIDVIVRLRNETTQVEESELALLKKFQQRDQRLAALFAEAQSLLLYKTDDATKGEKSKVRYPRNRY